MAPIVSAVTWAVLRRNRWSSSWATSRSCCFVGFRLPQAFSSSWGDFWPVCPTLPNYSYVSNCWARHRCQYFLEFASQSAISWSCLACQLRGPRLCRWPSSFSLAFSLCGGHLLHSCGCSHWFHQTFVCLSFYCFLLSNFNLNKKWNNKIKITYLKVFNKLSLKTLVLKPVEKTLKKFNWNIFSSSISYCPKYNNFNKFLY